MKNLANKYRPTTFNDVVGQDNIKVILSNQLNTGATKNAYLFVGSQGTGKTTCARIFAKEINKGQGNPIEMDAASNSGVDDVRNIIKQAQTKSLDSEYKVFIIDECHSISNTGWQAFLKLIEEPPAKSVFIFCTTNPEKIPKTILSRVQRFDFQRISQKDIMARLKEILHDEGYDEFSDDAIEYIAKYANGGLRDAITALDTCLDYNTSLYLKNVIAALGTVDYFTMFTLREAIMFKDEPGMLQVIDEIHSSGKDLKQFIKSFLDFMVDVCKYSITKDYYVINIPSTYNIEPNEMDRELMYAMMKLNNDIKWDSFPKALIEAELMRYMDDRTK